MPPDDVRRAVEPLRAALDEIFGARLHALVAYGPQVRAAPTDCGGPWHTLALVDQVRLEDLEACARRADQWRRQHFATPLLLSADEFRRSLDAFPLEYGDIIAHHVVVSGEPPFAGAAIRKEDLRRACEMQVKSHVIHLREGFIEAGGERTRVAQLIVASREPFAAVLTNVLQLLGVTAATNEQLAQFSEIALGLPAPVTDAVLAAHDPGRLADPQRLFGEYATAAVRLWAFVDGWQA